MACLNRSNPVPHCCTDSILECFLAFFHNFNMGSKKFHLFHIGHLPLCINTAHVYRTFQIEKSCCRGCCHSMLPCTCLCNDSFLIHMAGKEGLAQAVVNLMGPCMEKVFSFKIYFNTIFF